LLELQHALDQLPVLGLVLLGIRVAEDAHPTLFHREMDPGVHGELAQHIARHATALALVDRLVQRVDQIDQHRVLGVDPDAQRIPLLDELTQHQLSDGPGYRARTAGH
jgi:hypothetical protein